MKNCNALLILFLVCFTPSCESPETISHDADLNSETDAYDGDMNTYSPDSDVENADSDLVEDADPDPCALGLCGPRNMDAYPARGAFLVSSNDWRAVLALVPVTTWSTPEEDELKVCPHPYGGNDDICTYPTLIYHEEEDGIDLDPILNFLDRYDADEIISFEPLPEVVQKALGRTARTYDDPLALWHSFDRVVLVEEDYELALQAAPYASLLNVPLLIEGYNADIDYSGIEVICVGEPSSAAECSDQLDHDALARRYLSSTETTLAILTDPSDLDAPAVNSAFSSIPLERTDGRVREIYGDLSLVSPFLAAAKQELLLTFDGDDYTAVAVDLWLENRLFELGFTNVDTLTIVGAPNLLPHSRHDFNYLRYGTPYDSGWTQVDGVLYGDADHDFFQDYKVGRIFSFTISGTSAYVARVLFHDQLHQPSSFATLTSYENFFASGRHINYYIDLLFERLGLDMNSISCDARNPFDHSMFSDQVLLAYTGHGQAVGTDGEFTTTEFRNREIWMPSTLVVTDACATCSFGRASTSPYLFCAEMIRRGAIGFLGTTDNGTTIPVSFLVRVAKGSDFGTAFRDGVNLQAARSGLLYSPDATFIGDPTFNFGFAGDDNLNLSRLETSELIPESDQWILPINIHLAPTTTTSVEGAWIESDRLLDITTAPYYGGNNIRWSQNWTVRTYPEIEGDSEIFESSLHEVAFVASFENPEGYILRGIRSATREIDGIIEELDLRFQPDRAGTDVFAISNSEGTTFVEINLPLIDNFVEMDTTEVPAVDFEIELIFSE